MISTSISRSGCISLNRAAMPSMTARGAGLLMSDAMRSVPVNGSSLAASGAAIIVDRASADSGAVIRVRMEILPECSTMRDVVS